MVEVYHDYIPANARIVIDYKANEKVKFSYPVEWTFWKAVWQRGLINYIAFWAGLHYLIFKWLFGILLVPLIGGFCWYIVWLFKTPEKVTTEIVETTHAEIIQNMNFASFAFCWVFVLPTIVCYALALFKREWFSKLTPELGRWSAMIHGNMKQQIFKPEDVVNNTALLPNFKNFFLDYDATEDFSKYLTKVEILEFPQRIAKTKYFKFWEVKKTETNEWYWYARFIFAQKPEKGELKVVFA